MFGNGLSLSTALGLAMAATPLGAVESPRLLIGSYGDSIASYRFDAHSGHIDASSRVDTPAIKPSWLVVDAVRRRLFAVDESGSGSVDTAGRAGSFALDDPARPLRRLSDQPTGGDEPTHALLSADGRYLFVANYAVHADPGGSLTVLPVDAEGRLGAVSQRLTHPASKVNAERQASSHVHGVTLSPDGQRLYVTDLGADRVYIYDYAPALDAAQPLRPAATPYVALPPGSGPRHLVFAADGRHAYLVLEMTGQLAVFEMRDGIARQQALVELAPAGFTGKRGGGAVHLSADGRFLYATDRGEDNQLAVFAVDPSDGGLRLLQRRASEGREPREFSISADGRFLLVTNQFSDAVVVLRRDPASGELGELVQKLDFPAPSRLSWVPAGAAKP